MPEISVIMSVYWETNQQLKRSIDSILNQTFKNFEFIIILDNPNNFKAKTLIENYVKLDRRIVFLENRKNIKLGASLNKWIKIAQWKYIARMDWDDTCNLQRLAKQQSYFKKNEETDLLFTWWCEIDEQWETNIRIPTQFDLKNIWKTFFYKSPILHASMMCKKEILIKYQYPEIDRPEDFSLFLDLIYAKYVFDVLEENLYTFYVQIYDIDIKFQKIKVFSWNFVNILLKNTVRFYNNIYFWWMFFIVVIQWILSRNKFVFMLFFNGLQAIYKKLFQ